MKRWFKKVALISFHLLIARPVFNLLTGVRYRGRGRVPEGPCLVVSNHNSHLDAALLLSLFPLRRIPDVHPVAAADYFGSSWFMSMMAMLFMNGIPIDRVPSRGVDPLAPMVGRLEEGKSLIFFPEGSRGKAGVVARFRPGIGMLVRSVPGLLVLPVYLSGPERIWPRGEMVPVPLSIDVHVGRPRSYPGDLDPREIAAMVREDVLALAPPPPPEPGSPAAPPVRVAVCGVDERRRATVYRGLTEALGRQGGTVGLGESNLSADGSGVREASAPVTGGLSRLWGLALATLFRTGGRFRGKRFVEMVERAQANEALETGADVRFVVTEGSGLVDLMAWAQADFYRGLFDEGEQHHLLEYLAGRKRIPVARWWRFLRKAPEVWLINTLGLVRPPVPDIVVLVEGSVSEFLERRRSAGSALDDYENEQFLNRLQQSYRGVGESLERKRRVAIVEVREEFAAEAVVERVLSSATRANPQYTSSGESRARPT